MFKLFTVYVKYTWTYYLYIYITKIGMCVKHPKLNSSLER